MVALEHKVLVYDFKDLKLLHSIETLSNPTGLVALSPSQDQTVMACPGLHCGQVGRPLYRQRLCSSCLGYALVMLSLSSRMVLASCVTISAMHVFQYCLAR